MYGSWVDRKLREGVGREAAPGKGNWGDDGGKYSPGGRVVGLDYEEHSRPRAYCEGKGQTRPVYNGWSLRLRYLGRQGSELDLILFCGCVSSCLSVTLRSDIGRI